MSIISILKASTDDLKDLSDWLNHTFGCFLQVINKLLNTNLKALTFRVSQLREKDKFGFIFLSQILLFPNCEQLRSEFILRVV